MKSRRKILDLQFSLVALVGILLIGGGLWYYFNENRMVRYTDSKGGYSVKYPASWERPKVPPQGVSVIFYSPLEGDLDLFKENVNVVVQSLDNVPSQLEAYTKSAIQQIVAVFGENLKLVESEMSSLGGKRGHRITYIGRTDVEGSNLKITHVWTIYNGRAYQFTYSAMESQFDYYEDKANAMLGSFKFTK